ncbi:hypothetical protein AB0L13_15530 [Saccharopolyspora shandongensis]|uniref:hypothetical protein n=1 Tax=Saccharopolyspora shandongensis TaxID=418495 RepID=UPI00342311E4
MSIAFSRNPDFSDFSAVPGFSAFSGAAAIFFARSFVGGFAIDGLLVLPVQIERRGGGSHRALRSSPARRYAAGYPPGRLATRTSDVSASPATAVLTST